MLFPRPKLRDQLRDLLGVDIEQDPAGYTVVPEGIDVSVTDRAREEVRRCAATADRDSGRRIRRWRNWPRWWRPAGQRVEDCRSR